MHKFINFPESLNVSIGLMIEKSFHKIQGDHGLEIWFTIPLISVKETLSSMFTEKHF